MNEEDRKEVENIIKTEVIMAFDEVRKKMDEFLHAIDDAISGRMTNALSSIRGERVLLIAIKFLVGKIKEGIQEIK